MSDTRPANIEAVLSRLTNVKRDGDHWTADCPVPGHKHPAGHVTVKDLPTRAFIYHWPEGGHDWREIFAALGFNTLTYSTNGSKPDEQPFPKLSDAEAMALLKQSYGLTDATVKHFAIKPDHTAQAWTYRVAGGHRWKKYSRHGPGKYWSTKGTPNQLYGLADVENGTMEAWLVNGEPAVWVCWQAGIPAVCGIYGEGELPDDAVKDLKNKGGQVVNIIPDLDPAGKASALTYYNVLKADFKVKIRQLPEYLGEKADVADLFLWCHGEGFTKALSELPEVDRATVEKQVQESAKDRPGAVRLVHMKDVAPESVDWLWPPYIPKGKLTLLEGDPGIGKSWIGLAIATAVSLGRGLPGTQPTAPEKVLLASAEDGLGDTIRPRLDAMQADIGNVFAIEGPVDLSNGGLEVVKAYIETVGPVLVVIDPLVAYIGAGVDIHRANETRAIMAALADIAAKYHAAILAVRHLTKGSMTKAIYRGLGSIDLAAACRSVLLAGCDPEDSQKRGLVHIKSNLAPTGTAIGYELKDGRFFWKASCDLTAAKILAAENESAGTVRDEARSWLQDALQDGPVESKRLVAWAKQDGICKPTLDRAKKDLGYISRQNPEGVWFWAKSKQEPLPCAQKVDNLII
ncbi:MAG: AAA family ATPase [Chloroflexi bacterium]|nr:AAA family ATPase [Chloroflexota bacterium]